MLKRYTLECSSNYDKLSSSQDKLLLANQLAQLKGKATMRMPYLRMVGTVGSSETLSPLRVISHILR